MKPLHVLAAVALALVPIRAEAQAPIVRYAVQGDTIASSLTGRPGDPEHCAALMRDRTRSLCALCHPGPFTEAHLAGDLAPSLADVGTRLSPAQIRLRIIDVRTLSPGTMMPSFHEMPDASRVAAAWRDRPVLSGEEIEDIVAYLSILKG